MSTDKMILDPKQALTEKYYKDVNSKTFGNMKGSLVRAGYSEKYADSAYGKGILWLDYVKGSVEMIQKAEKNLRQSSELKINVDNIDKMSKNAIDMYKIKLESSKFILKTLAKTKYNDDTKEDKDQGGVTVNILNYKDQKPVIEVEARPEGK